MITCEYKGWHLKVQLRGDASGQLVATRPDEEAIWLYLSNYQSFEAMISSCLRMIDDLEDRYTDATRLLAAHLEVA